ncbi:MAG: hypothetical protein AAGJ38_00680 [Planctomycetota bacterium]
MNSYFFQCLFGGFAGALLLAACDTSAQIDLSDDPLNPTVIPLTQGSNAIGGDVISSGSGSFLSDIDFFTVVVPDGLQLESVILSRYEAPAVSFLGFNPGDLVSADPSSDGVSQAIFADGALGFALVGQNLLGQNLFTNLADGDVTIDPLTDLPSRLLADARRFDPNQALGAGSYAFVFQDTGPIRVVYELDFVVAAVPEPSALGLLLCAGLPFLTHRQRRPFRK